MQKKKMSLAERALLSEREKKYEDSATFEQCIEDLRKVQESFPLKYITRNFYRVNGSYSDATWSRYFGTFQEFRRQAGLELSRNQQSLERHIAKHASVDVYRNFYKEQVLPYNQKYSRTEKQKGRFKTVLVASDFHDIDSDRFCLSVFIDVAKRLQPDVISLNGDVFDMYETSKYSVDPRKMDIKKRFDFVKKEIFSKLRAACPKAQIDLIIANHEYRLLKILADKSPFMKVILADVMGLSMNDVFGLDEFEINMVAKFDLAAFTPQDVNDEIKQNYAVYYDSFVVHHYKNLEFGLSGTNGHTHRPEQVTFRNYPMGRLTWTNTGCMCLTDAEYIDGFCEWQNSFLIANIDREKSIVNHNHVMIPGDFVIIEGKLYEREE